MALGVSWR